VPQDEAVPTLSEMTVASLALLSTGTNGFFLVIEGGAIDWANHANQSGRMIEEDIDFERAVETVMNWIDADPSRSDTLLVVTADHESGYLLGASSGPAATYAIRNQGIHVVPEMDWYTTGHTNALVPFRARGPNAHHFCNDISGFDSRRGWYIDNAAIGARLHSMLQ
jgi:alkaline phosphatase